jgi:hypothetical protein
MTDMRPIEFGLKELAKAITVKSHRDKDIAIGNAAMELFNGSPDNVSIDDCLDLAKRVFNEARASNTKPA